LLEVEEEGVKEEDEDKQLKKEDEEKEEEEVEEQKEKEEEKEEYEDHLPRLSIFSDKILNYPCYYNTNDDDNDDNIKKCEYKQLIFINFIFNSKFYLNLCVKIV
jgi:hypothetical protein